jgi:hypothetical protein
VRVIIFGGDFFGGDFFGSGEESHTQITAGLTKGLDNFSMMMSGGVGALE